MNFINATLLQFSSAGLILLVLAYYYRNPKIFTLIAILYSLFLFDIVILSLPRLSFLHTYKWNWQGKILEFIWPLIMVYGLKWLQPAEVGLTLPKNKRWLIYAVLIGIGYDGLMFALSPYLDTLPQHSNIETILFQLTLPGLAEELFYRGTLWAVIQRYLPNPIRFLRLRLSWSFVLTTVLFISVHWISYIRSTGQIEWFIYENFPVLIISVMLGLIREKTKSIWPGVLLHNIINGGLFVLVYFVSS